MGGRGGLNILPQKKWNVYNWDNRIKVMENEKVVNKEIEKHAKRKKDKRLEDIVKSLKNKDKDNKISNIDYEIDDKEKNRIFKQIMSRQSMEKKLKVDLMFENMNNPMKLDERLTINEKHDNSDIENPIKENNNITFKESIKKHLNPWYTKKNPEDYEYYREFLKKQTFEKSIEENGKFLNKKHKKDNKKTIEQLREERLLREKAEKERINNFLIKKY